MDKVKQEVASYIENILRVCYHDCSDSAEEAEKYEARFNARNDDTMTIAAYIEEFALDIYAEKFQAIYDADLKDCSYYDTKKELENPVFSLPVPLEKIWDKLKLDERHKK